MRNRKVNGAIRSSCEGIIHVNGLDATSVKTSTEPRNDLVSEEHRHGGGIIWTLSKLQLKCQKYVGNLALTYATIEAQGWLATSSPEFTNVVRRQQLQSW
jgi:hypothetical protein